ncbi:hypothetical protein SUGI_0358900 [Cryptomeria japonica]|nr:hypothetical protein SUGI_0358900 [Cryptomeria japonica]
MITNVTLEVNSNAKQQDLNSKVVRGTWEREYERKETSCTHSGKAKSLTRLCKTSIESPDDVLKECCLDLGLFPADRKICADALLDIWVYVRKLQRQNAFAILSELANRNLLNLTSNSRGDATIQYGNASELYFSRCDGMRDLVVGRKRLVIERNNFGSLEKWELLRDRASDAQILSILTGPMEKNGWYNMNFPETDALLLFFTSTEYFLPPFLKSMKNMKFLMISNCGNNKATMKGLSVLSSLTQLKSVWLEGLISPLGGKQSIEVLESIEKLSLSLCIGFNGGKQSIEIPASIGKLEQLEYLDISLCEGLKELPKEIGQLKKLRELDVRECSHLITLPWNVCELSSPKLVTCDETIGKQWLQAKNTSIADLRVEIVEAQFSLDWLDD